MAKGKTNKKRIPRHYLFLMIAILTSPFCLCLLEMMPSSLQPPMFNLFEEEIVISNNVNFPLFLTPITTTTGEPMVIRQINRYHQVNIPVRPNHDLHLTYDAADRVLAGIVVCKSSGECRLLEQFPDELWLINNFDDLAAVDDAWIAALETAPRVSSIVFIYPLLALIPISSLILGFLDLLGAKRKKLGFEQQSESD